MFFIYYFLTQQNHMVLIVFTIYGFNRFYNFRVNLSTPLMYLSKFSLGNQKHIVKLHVALLKQYILKERY